MAPTPGQRKAAEALRSEGNQLFAKGKYQAAIDRYTEAITLDPSSAVLYVNRAMCHKKREHWDQVIADAKHALSLDRDLMKAHYLLGVSLRHQSCLHEAVSHLSRALEAARQKDDAIKDEIWRELAKAKYAAWQADSAERNAEAAALKQRLRSLLDDQRSKDLAAASTANATSTTAINQQYEREWAAWDQVFARAAHLDTVKEVPSAVTCPLTMEVFRDPAVTPSGQSYERSALLEHLAKVGKFDPLSRAFMSESDVRLNVGLRNATQQYLDEHPWAWGECV
eukprot:jgi/Chrzof1/12726/Cz07g05110.t1